PVPDWSRAHHRRVRAAPESRTLSLHDALPILTRFLGRPSVDVRGYTHHGRDARATLFLLHVTFGGLLANQLCDLGGGGGGVGEGFCFGLAVGADAAPAGGHFVSGLADLPELAG